MSRLDLLWTIKFENEKHEVETVSTISRLLLENILPKHVAEIIMKENMSQVKTSFYSVEKRFTGEMKVYLLIDF